MNTTFPQKKITRKDGTYFLVDADARWSDDMVTVYTPEKENRVLRTWRNFYDDIVAFCWLEEFKSEQLLS